MPLQMPRAMPAKQFGRTNGQGCPQFEDSLPDLISEVILKNMRMSGWSHFSKAQVL